MIELLLLGFVAIVLGSLVLEGLRALVLGVWWVLKLFGRAVKWFKYSLRRLIRRSPRPGSTTPV